MTNVSQKNVRRAREERCEHPYIDRWASNISNVSIGEMSLNVKDYTDGGAPYLTLAEFERLKKKIWLSLLNRNRASGGDSQVLK